MAGVSEIVGGWLQGNNVTDVTGNSHEPDGTSLDASDSTVDGQEPDVQVDIPAGKDGNVEIETSSGKADSGKAPKAGQTSPDKEVITISDEKGQRKIEIDYSNKTAIQNAYKMAHGARKWQAERDSARAELGPVKSQLETMKSNWDTLENVHASRGLEGVIDLLEGRQGAYKDHLKKALDRQEFIRRASPEELEALQHKENAEVSSRELDKIRKENEEFRKQMTAEKETAEMRATESKVHPAFDKYRFADKLGDPAAEQMFDQMLWKAVIDNLSPYEEQYGSATAIPQEIIDKEFRTVSTVLRNRINVQAEKKASKVVEQKKQEATEHVQAKIQSGYKTGGSRDAEMRKLMDQGSGGITKMLQTMMKKR